MKLLLLSLFAASFSDNYGVRAGNSTVYRTLDMETRIACYVVTGEGAARVPSISCVRFEHLAKSE